MAWGAVYWQYYQDMDRVESSGHALQVKKQFYIQQIVNNTRLWYPRCKGKTGDKSSVGWS